jgi:hypothetical protein
MKRVAFYVTGHGLGHAVRVVEVVKALMESDEPMKLFIRTTAPRWVFDDLQVENGFEKIDMDVGAVQRTSLWIDKEETWRRWEEMEKRWEKILCRESAFIGRQKIDLIFGDIPPLAFRLASAVGLPSIAMSNFGWDWIYEAWIEEKPCFQEIVDTIRQDYEKASLLLRLPAHEPMTSFRHVEDIPLVAGRAKKDREMVRRGMGIAEGNRIVLLVLHDSDRKLIPWDSLHKMDGIVFISPFSTCKGKNIIPFSKERVYFPDLVYGSDVVISKPGYGIVAECYANRTPMLYVLREDFRECDILVQWMGENMPCTLLRREDFFSGSWEESVQQLLSRKISWSSLSTNGAKIAAERILRLLE